MPELPEVETTRKGIAPIVGGAVLREVVVRNAQFRWPVPANLAELVCGRRIESVSRRAKYLLLNADAGSVIIHLGMSGSLRFVEPATPAEKHDHIDLLFEAGQQHKVLRFRDPRRFGCLLWQPAPVEAHPLLADLGPEPLSDAFSAESLQQALSGRSAAIKLAIMDSRVVVGVGNIYASEALFRARILPGRPAGSLGRDECARLCEAIRQTLRDAIVAGGSTLRDFHQADGAPGYFQQQYNVYGRDQAPCHQCGSLIACTRHGQRSTFWCPYCQV
ncbi:bifunctional DNA-formamidopyrimidine glycosylase/DNA-(apurinic or apyrimidinic site) lyase [Chitinimonas sp.]|uniref:bifunctional DNA-formamidopyrimidine glycosylase/DNA-(apurinic or apyrimidinic site) lyase n=1 Tax=Chitinimonas sp. TaxID=1934313 RepID=UPI0035AEF124